MTVDDVLARIRASLDLEAEAEHEVLEEIRSHLEEAIEAAQLVGLDEEAALAQAAARFGAEDVGPALQETHAGWGALEGIAAAALPVLFALTLRWLVFDPDGTAVGWRKMLDRPAVWALALVALLTPLTRSSRRRYALMGWIVLWGFSVLVAVAPSARW